MSFLKKPSQVKKTVYKVELQKERTFCWRGKYYTDNPGGNNGVIRSALNNIIESWNSHCFLDFMESLEKFDLLLSTSQREKLSIHLATKTSNEVIIFLNELIENFEGIYLDHIPYAYARPFFIYYVVNNGSLSEDWIIGYDTACLEDEAFFKHTVYRFDNGDLHEILIKLEDWQEKFQNKILENSTLMFDYKALPLKDLSSNANIIIHEIIESLK